MIEWFKRLVQVERARRKEDEEISPWLKLTDKTETYFYNFQTKQKSQTLPRFTSLKVQLPHMECKDLVVMRFTSWFIQKGTNGGNAATVGESSMNRKFINLAFFMDTEAFEIQWENGDVDNLKRIQAPHGGNLNCWDLHIGARVTIKGREFVLKEADPPTRTWLELNAKRLLKVCKSQYIIIRYASLSIHNCRFGPT